MHGRGERGAASATHALHGTTLALSTDQGQGLWSCGWSSGLMQAWPSDQSNAHPDDRKDARWQGRVLGCERPPCSIPHLPCMGLS